MSQDKTLPTPSLSNNEKPENSADTEMKESNAEGNPAAEAETEVQTDAKPAEVS